MKLNKSSNLVRFILSITVCLIFACCQKKDKLFDANTKYFTVNEVKKWLEKSYEDGFLEKNVKTVTGAISDRVFLWEQAVSKRIGEVEILEVPFISKSEPILLSNDFGANISEGDRKKVRKFYAKNAVFYKSQNKISVKLVNLIPDFEYIRKNPLTNYFSCNMPENFTGKAIAFDWNYNPKKIITYSSKTNIHEYNVIESGLVNSQNSIASSFNSKIETMPNCYVEYFTYYICPFGFITTEPYFLDCDPPLYQLNFITRICEYNSSINISLLCRFLGICNDAPTGSGNNSNSHPPINAYNFEYSSIANSCFQNTCSTLVNTRNLDKYLNDLVLSMHNGTPANIIFDITILDQVSWMLPINFYGNDIASLCLSTNTSQNRFSIVAYINPDILSQSLSKEYSTSLVLSAFDRAFIEKYADVIAPRITPFHPPTEAFNRSVQAINTIYERIINNHRSKLIEIFNMNDQTAKSFALVSLEKAIISNFCWTTDFNSPNGMGGWNNTPAAITETKNYFNNNVANPIYNISMTNAYNLVNQYKSLALGSICN